MADEKPSLHIDSDWKRQAQEEKKRLAEQQAREAPRPAPGPVGVVPTSPAAAAAPARAAERGQRGQRELPPASFDTLLQSVVTQVLYYLGELSVGGQAGVNLDMARHNLDVLGMLEEKTRGNLTPEEQSALDAALYEVRMRFISIASRYAELP